MKINRDRTPAEPLARREQARDTLDTRLEVVERSLRARAATLVANAQERNEAGSPVEAAVLIRVGAEFAALADELRFW